jgi:hypothetical protein
MHTASAAFFRIGTAIATSEATLHANTIIPINGAIISPSVIFYIADNAFSNFDLENKLHKNKAIKVSTNNRKQKNSKR